MNILLHLPAIAAEVGFDMGLSTIDRLSQDTPYLSPLGPNGPCAVSTLELVGGISAVLKVLAPLLDTRTRLCSGITLEEHLEGIKIDWELARRLGVLYPLDNPFQPNSGLAILYGTLAPRGAVVRTAGIDVGLEVFEGRARVFESEMDAWPAIQAGQFQEGEVLIIRNEGLIGGPGMPEESNIAWLLQDMGYRKSVYLVTDARFSGGQSGQCIGMVAPEAALGGPIAAVQDGDLIRIDLPAKRIDLLISEADLEGRLADWRPPQPRYSKGYLPRYVQAVSSPAEGAVLRKSK